MREDLLGYDKETLVGMLEDAAKLWLAHDGLWFLEAEKRFGLQEAIAMDAEAWRRFSPLEARRIMKRLRIEPGGGVEALTAALGHRLYSHINIQTVERAAGNTVVVRMNRCRVQAARERKGLEPFPCKEVGIIEYAEFAAAVDPRFATRCLTCPPDPRPPDHYCAWEFTLEDK